MAQFDPLLRRETWLFQNIGKDQQSRKPLYRRMGFNLVQYDGSPDLYIEPVNAGYDFDPVQINSIQTVDNAAQAAGAVVDFQFFNARPYEVHAFGTAAGA